MATAVALRACLSRTSTSVPFLSSRAASTMASILPRARSCKGNFQRCTLQVARFRSFFGRAAEKETKLAVPPPSSVGLSGQLAQPSQRTILGLRPVYVYAAGGTLVLGAAAYGMLRVSSFMASLNFWHVTSFGFFLGGAASTLLVGLGFVLYRRLRTVSPDYVFRDACRKLLNNPIVKERLGSNVVPGKFRAYAPTGGIIINDQKRFLRFLPTLSREKTGLQLMFQLVGDKGSGICSCDVINAGSGDHMYKSLAIDFQDGDRLVVVGHPHEVVFQGHIRLR